MVFVPIKRGIGTTVSVGKYGSNVGKRTIVGVAVAGGFRVMVGHKKGTDVVVGVTLGASMFVSKKKSFMEQACIKITSTMTKYNFRIQTSLAHAYQRI